jgi:thioredoxin-related protein
MKRIIILIGIVCPLVAFSQNNQGINFRNFFNWESVLKQAKVEQKNIFIDAFATWCGPCKQMDANVYPDKDVSEFVNTNFVALKIQFDQTAKDSDSVKKWYSEAKNILKKYNIEAFPTYLFISPNGELIHKGLGYLPVDRFLSLVKTAQDPQRNYAGKIRRYNLGEINPDELSNLALEAKSNNNDSLAFAIALAYKKTVIDHTSPEKILSPALLTYFVNFYKLLSINDPVITYMQSHTAAADSLLQNKGYSSKMIDFLITKDVIYPEIKPQGQYVTSVPNWNSLENRITKTYGPIIMGRVILNAKINWYEFMKDWPNVVKYTIKKYDSKKLDTTAFGYADLNNFVFFVILPHSTDAYSLDKGIAYMETILKAKPEDSGSIDTYANILYKRGRKNEAIQYEQKALKIATQKNNLEYMQIFRETIKKMQEGQLTWQ